MQLKCCQVLWFLLVSISLPLVVSKPTFSCYKHTVWPVIVRTCDQPSDTLIARSMWSDHLTKFKRFWTWHWAFLFRCKHLYCKWDIITRWCLRCSCRSSSHKRQNEYRAIEETTPYHLNFFSGSFLDLVVWCVYCAYAAANTFATNPVFRRVLWRDVLCIVTPRKIIRLHKETLDAFLTTVETGSLPSKSGDCYLTNLNSVHRVPFHKVWRVALQFNTCLNS